MHPDYSEDWEDFPDDWYDGADEILLKGQRLFLQTCFDLPCSQLNTEND